MSSKLYYLGIDGEQVGPFSEQEVLEKMRVNEVKGEDMVWWEGQENWVPLNTTAVFKVEEAPKKAERKRPQIGGDVASVLGGKSSLEAHPTFATTPDTEPVFKMSQVSTLPFVKYRIRFIITGVAILIVASLAQFYFSSTSLTEKAQKLKLSKKRSEGDRQAVFSKALSTLMTNSQESVTELEGLIKESPGDSISVQAVDQLLTFYRTMQRYREAGELLMRRNRPAEAARYFALDPSLTAEIERSTWDAYKQTKGEERKNFLLQNIQILVGPFQNIPLAIERIKIFETEFPNQRHPYSYYLKSSDEKIADLFSRTSFYFVQNLISYLNTELPQLKLDGRPLVEIKKSRAGSYKIVGNYKGSVQLNQDKLSDIYFVFWFVSEQWHIVDTNITKERRQYAQNERAKLDPQVLSELAMLQYMEGVFKAQFPKVLLHEAVDQKK